MSALLRAGAARGALRWLGRRETLLLLAVAALSRGTAVNFGTLSPEALALVVVGLGLTILAARAPQGDAGLATWTAAVAVCALSTLVYAGRLHIAEEAPLTLCLTAGCVLMLRGGRVGGAAATATALVVAAMVAAAWTWGRVPIDVFQSLHNAGSALLHGANPYLTTFRTPVEVAPGHWTDVTVHFQYLPAAALLAVPGAWLGDVRLLSVAAFIALIGFAAQCSRRSPQGRVRTRMLLALALASPLTLGMVHNAWVDVYCVAGFAGWVALRDDHRRLAIGCLACSMAVKPTIVVALLPWLVWSRSGRRDSALAALWAALLILPFAIATGFGAFYRDVIGVQAALGFRYDGLTVGAASYALTAHIPPAWLGGAAALGVAFHALRRRPERVDDLLMAGALIATAGFLLAKWAFFNYYFIPVWLLILATAARGTPLEAVDVALPALRRRTPVRALRRPQLQGAD